MSAVDHPPHYGGADDPYEVIKVLRAWLTPQEYAGFLKGNVIKYQARARSKGGQQDYAKALWYQRELVEFLNDVDGGYDVVYPPVASWKSDVAAHNEAWEPIIAIMIPSDTKLQVRFGVRSLITPDAAAHEVRWFDDFQSASVFADAVFGEAAKKRTEENAND